MTDLWTEATRDPQQERFNEALTVVSQALAPKFAFVLGASSKHEFEDRMSLVSEHVERIVHAATGGDPGLFPIVHEAVRSQWEADFDDLGGYLAAQTQRKNSRRGYERQVARGKQVRVESSRKTALAPFPTATVEIRPGEPVTVYAAPSKTGQPKNAWIAVERRPDGSYVEWFGGATREIVARRAQGGPWFIIETGKYEWLPTPASRLLATRKTAKDKCKWLVEVPTASLYPPEAEWYPDSPSDVYTTVECGGDVTYDAGGWTCSNGHNHRTYGGPEHQEYWDEDEIAAGRNRFGRKTAASWDDLTPGTRLRLGFEESAFDGTFVRIERPYQDHPIYGNTPVVVYTDESGAERRYLLTSYRGEYESPRVVASRKTGSVGQVVRDSGWSAPLKDSLDSPGVPRTRTLAVDALGKGMGNLLVTLTFDWPNYEVRVDPYPGKVVASGQTSSLGVIESAALEWIKKNVTPEWYGKSRDDAVAAVASRKQAGPMFPGAGAQVYYNEAGEPTGWDDASYEPDPHDAYDNEMYDRGDSLGDAEWENGYERGEEEARHGVSNVVWEGPYNGFSHGEEGYVSEDFVKGYIEGWGVKNGPESAVAPLRQHLSSRQSDQQPPRLLSTSETAHLASTVVAHGGKVHWAVTTIDGEREFAAGTHDSPEAAQRLSAALARTLEAKYVWVDDEDDKDEDKTEDKSQDAPAEAAPEDPAQPPQEAATEPDKSQDAPPDDQPADQPPVDQKPTDQPQPTDQVQPADPSVNGDPTQSAPESQDGTAEESEQVADPTTMEVGQGTTMSYVMAGGGNGSVEVTFVREDNGIFYFNGPTGEFGVAQREGRWIDAASNEFTFGVNAGAPQEGEGQANAPTAEQQQVETEQKPPKSEDGPPKSDGDDGDSDAPPKDEKKDDEDDDEKKKGDNPFAKKSGTLNVSTGSTTTTTGSAAKWSVSTSANAWPGNVNITYTGGVE